VRSRRRRGTGAASRSRGTPSAGTASTTRVSTSIRSRSSITEEHDRRLPGPDREPHDGLPPRGRSACLHGGHRKAISRQHRRQPEEPGARDAPGYQRKVVQPSTVLNGAVSLDLGRRPRRVRGAALALDVRGFNRPISATRRRASTEVPYFYPAARRNAFVSLRAEF
jgi:hypothetical protein